MKLRLWHKGMICALYMAPAMAGAQTYIVDAVRMRSLPTNVTLRNVFVLCPATIWYADSLSLARCGIGAVRSSMTEPVMEQTGDGLTTYRVEAEAYKRLDDKRVTWGAASYTSSTIDNVRWTDCIDYEYVAPYVLGDDKGGDVKSRRYNLSGGYATSIGAWTFGATLSYRAETAYRDIDPRIHTVVSDLKILIGATHSLGNYIAGISTGVSTYNQNCTVEFYNPINDTNTYPLTGLGSWYSRFMGNTNKSSGHEAIGWKAGVQLLPSSESGAFIIFGCESYRMNQHLRSFNNIVPGFTDNAALTAQGGWKFRTSALSAIMPFISLKHSRRSGTENLFGPAAGNSYDRIGSRKAYRQQYLLIEGKCHLQASAGAKGYLTLTPGVAYASETESLADPMRKIHTDRAIGGLEADYSRSIASKWLLSVSAGYSRSIVTDSDAILTGLDTASPLGMCVMHNYQMQCAALSLATATLSTGLHIGGTLCTLTAGFRHTRHEGHGHDNQLSVSLSTIF